MRSGTSFFNLALYRKTINRFWPLWAVNLVFWVLFLPMDGLMTLLNEQGDGAQLERYFSRGVGDFSDHAGLAFALLAGIIVAMAVCSSMYNNRSANFMGSLPVRREGQFLSTYLAGLTMLLGPNVLVFLLTLLVEVAGNALVWTPLLYWLMNMCLMEFFFFTFAVCLGQFTGHILALPVYYGIFNGIVMVGYSLLDWVLGEFYFGFTYLTGGGKIGTLLTPVAAFASVQLRRLTLGAGEGYVYKVENPEYLLIYTVATLVLAVCALLLHRRRHLETAGDAVAVKAMRPVFKYGVAICAGLCLGYVTSQMLGFGTPGLMISIVIWGLVGYFVAQMILDKTIRVFKKWKGAVGVTVAFLLLFATVGFDLLGYESRVPDPEDVESVQLYGLSTGYGDSGNRLSGDIFDDPEIIADVIALHQAFVDFGPEGEDDGDPDTYTTLELRVNYTLKSGRILSRYYRVPAGETLLGLGQAVREHYEVRWKAYSLSYVQDLIENCSAKLEQVELHGNSLSIGDYYFTDKDSAPRLWKAVMDDFEAGNIGVGDVLGSDWYEKGETSAMYLSFEWFYRTADGYGGYNIQFAVPESAVNTRAVLKELWADGILGDPAMLKG